MVYVPLRIVLNFSRFMPALNCNRFFCGFETRLKFFKFGLMFLFLKLIFLIYCFAAKVKCTEVFRKSYFIIECIKISKNLFMEWIVWIISNLCILNILQLYHHVWLIFFNKNYFKLKLKFSLLDCICSVYMICGLIRQIFLPRVFINT